ncbi:membrane-associating domain protein [Rhizoctonia solani]|uniref:Membrane-associating domain protein n=1 Tax=Rhizoctonia solani TaxID=456999 RepID=A0A8H8STC9_9AGAM|nr:membrane-associating domain protein [Rhizoctonia solani]QRW15943.1 membrane-associating domain protein [Rhizoctonia solani]
MPLFDTVRLASYATVLVFSLIVLGISGYWVGLFQGAGTGLGTPASFSLAVSVITWAFMFPALLVSTFRRGSFLSWVAIELGICGFLWVLWLASAAYTTSLSAGMTLNCDLVSNTGAESICRQYQAIQAFSWLNWLILFAYIVLVIALAIKGMNKGQSVWTMEISDLSAAVSGSGSTSATSNHVGKVVQDQPSHYQQPQYNQPAQHHPQGMAQV